MHQLVPPLILHHAASQQPAGRFHAVCLFVDTAGFTPLTSALMAHGTEGIEIIAEILQAVFRPLVYAVYAQGGFIAGFAGDSFKAVFSGSDQATYQRCLLAADAMRRQMERRPQVATRFGNFEFAIKLCVADGSVDWQIWQAQTPNPGQQSAAYTFTGEALARCMALDSAVAGGEVMMTAAVYQQFDPALLAAEAVGQHWRLTEVHPDLLARAPGQPVVAPGTASDWMDAFMPESVRSLAVQGEFRQVVTMFINLREIPGGAAGLALQQTLFRLLGQHGGYLCRIGQIGADDPGATLLLFWGAPTSLENDLKRALDFGLDLLQQIGVPLRAGVTNQLVYAGFVGADIREEYTCYGSAVNLAARLMITAEWGEILLDAASTDQASAAFVCASKGVRRFKGFDHPQPVWALVGQQGWRATLYTRPLIGRERELSQLQTVLAPIHAGQAVGLTLIRGEAGIGKSRLVHELQRSRAAQWFHCPADHVVRQSLHPFRYLLRSYFAQSPLQTAEENKLLFDYGIEALAEVTPDAGLQAELRRTRSLLGALVDLHWPDSLYAQLEPQGRFENTLDALKTLFKAESLRRPVVIHVEDAHWLDADSAECLQHIQRNIASYPLAIVVTARSAPPALGAPHTTIELKPLTARELESLAEAVLESQVSPALVVLLVERAEGNPYFAEQLLLYLHEHDLLVAGSGGLAPASVAAILPGNVRSLLTARLDRLPPEVRQLVQVAAVLGREFSVELLGRMFPTDQALEHKLQLASAAAIWQPVRPSYYSFSHDLLRDAAYDLQLRAGQRQIHELAASTLESQDDRTVQSSALAYHYEQAQNYPKACLYLERAGEEARKAYQNSSALDYYARLIALLRHDPTATAGLIAALLQQVAILEHTSSWAEARTLAGEALELATQHQLPAAQAEIQGWIGYLWGLSSDYGQALSYQNQALEFYRRSDDGKGFARTLNRIGMIYRDQGAFDQALPCYREALAISQAQGLLEHMGNTLNNLGLLYWQLSDYEQSLHSYQEALRIARQRGDKGLVSKIFGNLGLLYWQWSQPAQALGYYQQALDMNQEFGNRAGISKALGNIGLLHADQSEYDQALEYYQRALDLDRELGNEAGVARQLGNTGLIYGNQGRFDQALHYHQQALEIDQKLGNHADVTRHRGNIAELYRHKGDYRQALAYYDQTIPSLRAVGAKYYLAWQLIQKAEILFLCRRYAEARTLSAEGLALALSCSGDKSDILAAQVLDAKLRAVAGDVDQACADLEALLPASAAAERALFLYTLWQLRGTEADRQAALKLYKSVYAGSANIHDKHRLNALLAGDPGGAA
ncbi:MAG: tetratricopeptide repeat protein [Herpetosiphonaceae bacterium]|nr:tetratricopeptide repeat protein [Herpetosiphonaceae bacterium]